MTLQKLNIQPKVDSATKKRLIESGDISKNETILAAEINAIAQTTNKLVEGFNQITPITGFKFKENLPTYADLATVENPQLNDGYGVIADGLIYVFNGDSFPTEGNGMDLGLKPSGTVTENEVLAVSGKEVFEATLKKIDLKPISVNLFDRDRLEPGFYIHWETGQKLPLAGYNATDFTAIEPNEQYTASIEFQIAFYDRNFNYISGIAAPTTFTTPVNAAYCKTAVPDYGLNRYSLVLGSVKKIAFRGSFGLEQNGVRAEKVAGIDLIGLEKNIQKANLFDETKIIRGSYIDSSTGDIITGIPEDYYSTLPIRVNGCATYEFGNLQNQQFAMYDDQFNYIGGYAALTVDDQSKTVTTVHNARYIAFTGFYGTDQYFIEKENVSKFDRFAVVKGKYVDWSSGELGNVAEYSVTVPIAVKPDSLYEWGDIQVQQLVWLDINKNYISGWAGSIHGYKKQLRSPKNAYYTVFTQLIRDLDAQYLIEIPKAQEIETVTLTAVQNADNWNSIRDLANSIKDASYWKRYEIFVPNGEWNEIDWPGWGPYVKIKGQNRYLTIINTDGISTNPKHIIPDDYMGYGSYKGLQVSDVPQIWKHLIFARRDLEIENLTMKCNDGKYTVHIDNPGFERLKLNNCTIIEKDCHSVFGMGIWSGQIVEVFNSVVKSTTGSAEGDLGIFIHNWDAQTKGTLTHFKNVDFQDVWYALVDELQSFQSDILLLENCKSNFKKLYFKSDDVNKQYNLQVILANTDVDSIIDENRPQYADYNQL